MVSPIEQDNYIEELGPCYKWLYYVGCRRHLWLMSCSYFRWWTVVGAEECCFAYRWQESTLKSTQQTCANFEHENVPKNGSHCLGRCSEIRTLSLKIGRLEFRASLDTTMEQSCANTTSQHRSAIFKLPPLDCSLYNLWRIKGKMMM